uniref:E3 ubiquitin-protein ligase RBBP6 n=1 Tax=Bursaphelenchus xylophilus TaxID=6326 RepID=A0A1I7S6V8_BURXY
MSTIHYKFHSCVTYTTITFDDLHVRVNELKKAIYEKENLSPEQFDLLVENAHTKRVYSDDQIVPRNSSVIVRRCPRENTKAPKVHDQSTSGIVGKAPQQTAPDLSFIDSIDFSKMTEQERLAHIKKVSSEKYAQQNFRRTTNASAFSEPPPPNYTCNRCSRTGHWYRDCPLVNIRRTTGIPMEELVETTADDPHAMLHPSGKFMVQRMHMAARITSKAKHPQLGLTSSPNIDETGQSPRPQEEPIPEELQCPLCKELLKEAVLTVCCGQSFCMSCMMQVIMSDDTRCPGQDCSSEITNNSIVENKQLRRAVEKYRLAKSQPTQKPVNMDAIASTLPVPLIPHGDSSLVDDAQDKHSSQFPRTHMGLNNRSGATPTSQTNGNSIMNISPALNTVASTNSQPLKLPTVDLTKMLPTPKPVIPPAQPLVNNVAPISTPTIDHIAPKARPKLDDTAPPGTLEESTENDVENDGDAREREEKKKSNDINKLWESLLQRDEVSGVKLKAEGYEAGWEGYFWRAGFVFLGRPTLGGASKLSSRTRKRSKSPLATRRSNRSRSPRVSKRKPERQREESKKDRDSRRRRSRSPERRRSNKEKSKSPRKRSHRRKRSRTPEDDERKETPEKKRRQRKESQPQIEKEEEAGKSDTPTKLTAEENEIDNVIQETKEKLRTFSATTSETDKSSPSEKMEIPSEKVEEVFEKDEEMEKEKPEEEEKELEKPPQKVSSPKFIDETKLIDSFRPVEEIEKENGKEKPKEEPKHHEYENEIALEEEEDEENGHSPRSDHENNNEKRESDSSDSSDDEKSERRKKKADRKLSREERKSEKKKKKKHKKHHKDDREHKKKKKREREEKSTESRKRRRSSSDSDDESTKKKKKKHKKRDK